MRALLTRLAALTGATALVVTGVVGTIPAADADPGDNLVVTIVDTSGRPTEGSVMLLPVSDPDMEHAILLGSGSADPDATPIASTHRAVVPPGSYGVMVITGWGGATCRGVSPCSIASMMHVPGTAPIAVKTGVAIPASGNATLKIATAIPVLRGRGNPGQSLTVDFPAGYDDLQRVMKLYLSSYNGGAFVETGSRPVITWRSATTDIAGANGSTYVPTTKQIGSKVTATVAYNPVLAALLGSMVGGPFGVPQPLTTNAVSVRKVATKLALKVPHRARAGQRPKARVTVKGSTNAITGWARVTVSGQGAQRVMVRRGFAAVTLPKLKPGKRKVTATFLKTKVYGASKARATVVVKKK